MSEINELFAKCDGWHAKEWFERLVKAVDSRNEAVRSGDEIAFATHNNIASSTASRLAMEFRDEIRAALSSAAVAEREPVAFVSAMAIRHHIDSGTSQTGTVLHREQGELYGEKHLALYLDPPPTSELEAENARLRAQREDFKDEWQAELDKRMEVQVRLRATEARLAEALKALEKMVTLYESEYDPDFLPPRPVWLQEVLAARRVREGGKVE